MAAALPTGRPLTRGPCRALPEPAMTGAIYLLDPELLERSSLVERC